MWFTPCLSSSPSVASASACETEARAAAPKIMRVFSWPVFPNGAVPIIALRYPHGCGDVGRVGVSVMITPAMRILSLAATLLALPPFHSATHPLAAEQRAQLE